MDVYSFLNSNDVRDYLMKIKYDFCLLEQAYIIFHSRFKAIKEKEEAFRDIVSSTEDYVLGSNGEKRWNSNSPCHGKSVHELLRRYADDLRVFSDGFFKVAKDEYCTLTYLCEKEMESPHDSIRWEDGNVFVSVQEAYEYALEEIREFGDYSIKGKCTGFVIYKNLFKRPEINSTLSTRACFNTNGEMIEVDPPLGFYDSGDIDIIEDFFESMWFDIPVPFKKGDIVKTCCTNWGNSIEPFVLLGTCPWWYKEKTDKAGRHVEGCDSSDMNAYGWSTGFYESDPLFIHDDVRADYLDLEFYHGEYEGAQRLLPLLAKAILGEIDTWTYTYAYRLIKGEYEAERARNEMGTYIMKSSPVYSIIGE